MGETGAPLIHVGQLGKESDKFVDLFASTHGDEALFDFNRGTRNIRQFAKFVKRSTARHRMITVDFFLGLGSRYSYLAASQIDRIEIQSGCRFIWKPIASGLLIERRRSNPFSASHGAGPYSWSYRAYDARGWAAHYGIPFQEPAAFEVDSVVPALACLAADKQGRLIACCRFLQQLIFAEGATIGAATIAALPAQLGLDQGRFRRDLKAPETRARHEELIDEAERRGAFGVPTFFVGQRMFWGNDRLPLLEAALRGTELPRWTDR